jgi:heat shock protein HslJ
MRLGPQRLRGSGGCSAIDGRYGRIGAAITFRLHQSKTGACAEQTALVQRSMLDGLRRASSFDVIAGADARADRLVLRSVAGVELLRFRLDDIGGLDQADWQLTGYTSEGRVMDASSEQPAILALRPTQVDLGQRSAAGAVTVSTGCNGVVTEFRRRADLLTFGDLQRTDAPCTPALAAQEEAMVSVLQAATMTISLLPDELVLTSDTGERLIFASQRPLEGTTWLLQTDLDREGRSDAVTLWLEDGAARGEGPCGSYSASYLSDGLFITFTHAAGADAASCRDGKSQRKLLAGLRAAVQVERAPSGVRLIDASGRVALRFSGVSGP